MVALNLCNEIRTKQLPQLRQYISKEDYEHYNDAFSTCTGYYDLNERFFFKMFGYKNKKHMNDYNTLNGRLNKIEFPVFAFGAHDDLMLPSDMIPKDEIERSSQPFMVATSHKGGHVCHITGNVMPECWYPIPCAEFLLFIEGKFSGDKKNN